MTDDELQELHEKFNAKLAEIVAKNNLAIEELTEQQVVKVFKQAIQCGDIRKLIRYDSGSQCVIYIPFEREERLTAEKEELSSKLRIALSVLDECREALKELKCYDQDFYNRTCPGLIEAIQSNAASCDET